MPDGNARHSAGFSVSLRVFCLFSFVCLFVLFCFFNVKTKGQPATPNKCSDVQILLGRVFEEQKLPPPPPKKILLSLQYISNYIKKNHPDATRSVHKLEHFSKLCLKMHQIASQCTFISKYFRGSMLPDPLGTSWPPVPRDFSPKQ